MVPLQSGSQSDVMSCSSWRAGLLRCAALAALVSVQTADTAQAEALELADDALLTIWPQQSDATLQHTIERGHLWVSASSGGILGSRSMSFDAETQTTFDPRIEAIEITWIPSSDAHSSTFDRVFASSSQFATASGVGMHIHVPLRSDFELPMDWSNATHQQQIETNVRAILLEALPSSRAIRELHKGFLARSLCKIDTWSRAGDLLDSLSPSASPTCLSSSFALPRSELTFAPQETPAQSSVEEQLYPKFVPFVYNERLTTLVLKHTKAGTLHARLLQLWIAPSFTDGLLVHWDHSLPVDLRGDIAVVRALEDTRLDVIRFKHDELVSSRSGSLQWDQHHQFHSASVKASVQGDGFHQRFVMDVNLTEPTTSCKKLVVRLPLSRGVYADLDELRRMERFGELRLLSSTKHIEIERPATVSPQHVIALEFDIASAASIQVDIPIHLRYEAPSETESFRPASILPPELLVFCPSDEAIQDRPQTSQSDAGFDDKASHLLQEWLSIAQIKASTPWHRLTVSHPLELSEVPVPVGFIPSSGFVSLVTLSVASLGALLLVIVSIVSTKDSGTNNKTTASWTPKKTL